MSNDDKLRPYLRRATDELREVRRRLRDTEARAREPIALIGAGCRFPGGVASIEDLWRIVTEGIDAIGGFPADRGWVGPHGPLAGAGGFMPDATRFDAGFFGVSPREARAMDPQQRVLLEVAWEAIERARMDAGGLRGRPVGVFVGVCPSEYGPRQHEGGPDAGHLLTGSAPSVASGRVAYLLGVNGPALSVDTACSSSLVAIHLAAQALRSGQCELALAGGVSVLATPGIFAEFAAQGGLAADGRCKPFAAAADGTGWAEGAGMVVLERLSDAVARGHPVWAVIRGSAVNQDGASNGLTAPSGNAQQRVIADALADAGLSPADVDAIEAHGTGTRLGDPIEAAALAVAYRPRPHGRPLWLGSIKSNIGHTQAAAGVAGLLKMTMAIRHGLLPESLHATPPSPHVDWDASGLAPLSDAVPWPETGGPRRAAVSAFGISGTNAHLILEQAPQQPPPPQRAEPAARPRPVPVPVAWPLSAKSAQALAATGRRLHAYLADRPGWSQERVGFSLATTRATFAHRAVVLGRSRAELLAAVAALAEDRDAPGLTRGAGEPGGQLAYVFPGHGGQYPGMGRDLSGRYPVFAAALEQICGLLDPRLPVPLRRVMFAPAGTGDAALLDDTLFTHAAVFAYQTALFRLLQSFGLEPDRLVGHSLGEITAAHVAGILTLPDACALVATRGALLATLPEGAMAALGVAAEEIEGRHPDVTVAAYNSPTDIVVSGDPAAVDAVVAHYRERGRPAVRLAVARALHSPATHAVLDEFRRTAQAVSYGAPAIPVISTVTGAPADDGRLRDPEHWIAHIARPVRFAPAIEHLGRARTAAIIELAPRPTLAVHVRRTLGETHDARVAVTGRPGHGEPGAVLAALALAHVRTAGAVRWEKTQPSGEHAVDLPTYPFQRQRYWHPAAVATAHRYHPLAGIQLPLAGGGRWFSGTLSVDEPWFVAQHTLFGVPVLPASAMLEWAFAAARHGGSAGTWALREVTFHELLTFSADRPVSVQAAVEAGADGDRVRCFARPADQPDGAWTEHVSAAVADVTGQPRPIPVDIQRLLDGLPERDAAPLYRQLMRRGLAYGPAFRGLRRLFRAGDEAVAQVETGQVTADAGDFVLHPVVLDACFHVAAAFLPAEPEAVWLPAGADRVVVHDRLPARVWCHARWRGARPSGAHAMDLVVLSEAGDALVTVEGLRLHPASRTRLAGIAGTQPRCQEIRWQPCADGPDHGGSAPAAPDAAATWLVYAADPALARRWRAELVQRGHPAVGLFPAGAAGSGPESRELRTVDLESEDDARRVFTAVRRRATRLAGLVMHTGQPAAGDAGDPVEAAYRLTRHGFLLLKYLLKDHAADRPEVVVCSVGAAAPAGGSPAPPQATLTGLARSVVAEYPEVRCVHVDLEPGAAAPPIGTVLDRAAQLPGSGHLAWRDERWYEARLRESVPAAATPVRIRGDASYLVTGGLGGLGLAVAAWLADQGARYLLLSGRTIRTGGPRPAAEPPEVAALRCRGVRVELRPADVADEPSVNELLRYARRELPPLRGVVHAAGVTADGSLGELDWGRFVEVLDPKVRGAWHLHRATAGLELDFFVLFSSLASMIGSAGQANYVAANAFLDALAGYRRARGLPATSVSWGPWAGTGMAHRRGLTDRLAAAGLHPVDPRAGLDALGQLLCGPAAHVGIAAVDWRQVAAGRRPPDTLLADLLPAEPATPRTRNRDELLRLVLEDPAAAREVVLAELLDQVASLLRLAPGDQENLRASARYTHLNRLGLDSLTTVQLRNQILLDFSADVPPDILFGATSALDVATSICQQLAVRGVADTGAGATPDLAGTEVITL
jgi:acyl transferase domain-containing protein